MNRNKSYKTLLATFIGAILVVASGCERGLSEDAEFATWPKTGPIFLDNFVGLGSNFYFPFVTDGAKPDVFSVDPDEGYESNGSIRIDVPNANDPAGNFAGAAFIIDGGARNLTEFDALTFWAKSTQAASIEVAFGDPAYRVGAPGINLTSAWQQYIIPIPDPSKLVEISTVFEFSAGGILPGGAAPGQGLEVGYSFWLDEIQFEKLGTIAQPRPAILAGQDVDLDAFVGQELSLNPLTVTYNLANGRNQTVVPTPNYFNFSSTDPDVARINQQGNVAILDAGTAEVTATIRGVRAQGSLNLNVLGAFNSAPEPPVRDPADVISIFSDAYTDLPAFQPVVFNNAELNATVNSFGDDEVLSYGNLGFVGLGWEGTSDISGYSFLHIDIQVDQSFDPAQGVVVELIDFGANNADGGGDDTGGGFRIDGTGLTTGQWVGVDIPVTGFTRSTGGGFAGSPNLTNIARVVFVGDGISDIIVDNIYFYR